jgi:hypothetical protein
LNILQKINRGRGAPKHSKSTAAGLVANKMEQLATAIRIINQSNLSDEEKGEAQALCVSDENQRLISQLIDTPISVVTLTLRALIRRNTGMKFDYIIGWLLIDS